MGFETYSESQIAEGFQWACFLFSWILFVFYAWQVKRQTCGWEVIYIAWVEMIKYILEIWWEESSPATIRLTNGTIAPWLRYAEWLLTCPVILIALSRVGSAEGSYSRRTMKLLTSDQGTIIMGVTAAYSKGIVKICFFFVGCIYGFNTFYTAATVYLEAFKNVPEDCQPTVKWMAICFYTSWLMFPILFVAGPEGLGHISSAGSIIGHSIADLLSKNLWGLFDWWLDYNVKLRALMEGDDDEEDGSETSKDGSMEMAPYSTNVIVADPLGSMVPFFTAVFEKLPATLIPVSNLEDLSHQLHTCKENGKSPDFCLIAPTFLEQPEYMQLRAESGVKMVLYVEGLANIPVEVFEPFAGLCDDFVDVPVAGNDTYDDSAITKLFYKHATSLTGPTATLEAHMAAQTALLLQIQSDISRLNQHTGLAGKAPVKA